MKRPGLLTSVYGLTLFLSAALLFYVQLIFSRMVLPLLGGSPAVWTTCMLFFQLVLLLGYAYAHGTSTRLPVRWQIPLHFGLIAASIAFVPVVLASGSNAPSSEAPVLWLLGLLAASLGIPFLLLSTTAPLLQRWFSLTGHPSAGNPYFLYAASNVGSLVALLSYPVLVEPWLTLKEQRQLWAWGFWILCAAIVLCARVAWKASASARQVDATRVPAAWSDRLWWAVLAFIPSSLLLGVTSYISTDIAAIPFIWVVPLFLYLLTYVLVFARRPPVSHEWMVRLQPWLVLPIFIGWYWSLSFGPGALVILHLAAFFVTAMVCHGELSRRRPSAAGLTEFYFWLSAGGALGGVVNGLLAPVLFRGVAEYPLALLAGSAVAPMAVAAALRPKRAVGIGLALLSGAILAACTRLVGNPHGMSGTLTAAAVVPVSIASAIAVANSLTLRRRPALFALSLATILLAGWLVPSDRSSVLHAERDFFGVHRVKAEGGGRYHTLYHGTTLHGAQEIGKAGACEPLTYFSRRGPLGQALAALPAREGRRVGVIGLGAGSVAAYAVPGERWTFFEIDPAVERMARDPQYFRFLTDCADSVRVVQGDGRLTLTRVPDASLDLLILDAFSSDAIPAHLLTREALGVYRAKLAPAGVILFHISNRHLNLAPVVGALVRDAGMAGRYSSASPGVESPGAFTAASVWAVIAPEDRDLGSLARDSAWIPLPVDQRTRVWTDDYSNVWGALGW
ncbi:MAG TPA: fused MFS/spermidine synthase [Gemmatimonadales bacterium]